MSYIVLTHVEPGNYIPKHDPSYVHSSLESAMEEVDHDRAYGKDIAIWRLEEIIQVP